MIYCENIMIVRISFESILPSVFVNNKYFRFGFTNIKKNLTQVLPENRLIRRRGTRKKYLDG